MNVPHTLSSQQTKFFRAGCFFWIIFTTYHFAFYITLYPFVFTLLIPIKHRFYFVKR